MKIGEAVSSVTIDETLEEFLFTIEVGGRVIEDLRNATAESPDTDRWK